MRTSQHFAQKKQEAIVHLQSQTFGNRKERRQAFFKLMSNLVQDFKGEIITRDIIRRDGRELKDVRVVVFADKSYARAPRIEELETFVPKKEEEKVFTEAEMEEAALLMMELTADRMVTEAVTE